MKTELFFSILSSLFSPLPGETGNYNKYTWKDQWVNVSVDTPIANYQTNNRLYVGTNGMVNNTEKVILRIDRTATPMNSYDKSIVEFNINVECVKKESTITHVVYKNSINEITSMVKIDKTQSEKFDDSHLFGAICTARVLNDVLVNHEVKTFDSCDFRQQTNGVNAVKYDYMNYNFPIRWSYETCKAAKNAVWLYGAGQVEAAKKRLAWAPPLAMLIEQYSCTINCKNYSLTRFFTN